MVSAAALSAANGLTECAYLEHAGSKGLRFSTACNQRAVAYLRDRLGSRRPKGRTALPPKREIILTPLNRNIQGAADRLFSKSRFLLRSAVIPERTGCFQKHMYPPSHPLPSTACYLQNRLPEKSGSSPFQQGGIPPPPCTDSGANDIQIVDKKRDIQLITNASNLQ